MESKLKIVTCEGCGAECVPNGCTTGYGTTADGRRLCYACCNAAEAAEFATADTYTAYMSADGRRVTTWPGGTLARITYTKKHRGGFGGEYFTADAVAPDGSQWYGRGGGPGCWLRLRRRKKAE